MAKAAATGTRYCECLSIAGGLRDCPAHGAFATASARRDYEGEIAFLRGHYHRLSEERDWWMARAVKAEGDAARG